MLDHCIKAARAASTLTLLLCVCAAISTTSARAEIDLGAAAVHCYQVSFKNMVVKAIHSPNSDTDYVSMHLDHNDTRVLGGTVKGSTDGTGWLRLSLGDIGTGTYDVDFTSAKVCMPGSDRLRVTYRVDNHGANDASAPTTDALQHQALQNNPAYDPYGVPAGSDSYASRLVDLVGTVRGSGCNDIVAGEILEFTGADLHRWLNPYEGTATTAEAKLDIAVTGATANPKKNEQLRVKEFTLGGSSGFVLIGGCKDSDYITSLVFAEVPP